MRSTLIAALMLVIVGVRIHARPDRFAQTPELTLFNARVEALHRIEAAQLNLTDAEARAEMALHWAEAMDRAASALPASQEPRPRPEPYASWLAANRKYLGFDEPGSTWRLHRDTVLTLHRTYASTNAADDIAWLLITVGDLRECEGYMPCYVDHQNFTYGEYLRLHPKGRHSESAVESLRQWMVAVLREGSDFTRTFVAATQCDALKTSVARLHGAVVTSNVYRRGDVTAQLDELIGRCGS